MATEFGYLARINHPGLDRKTPVRILLRNRGNSAGGMRQKLAAHPRRKTRNLVTVTM
jgi:hypothetical protein